MFLCCQVPHEEAPAKKLRLSKPSKSAALHIDLCKATSSTDALQYLLQFARKPVEAESVEGVIRILLEHYYKVKNTRSATVLLSQVALLSFFVDSFIVYISLSGVSKQRGRSLPSMMPTTVFLLPGNG